MNTFLFYLHAIADILVLILGNLSLLLLILWVLDCLLNFGLRVFQCHWLVSVYIWHHKEINKWIKKHPAYKNDEEVKNAKSD